MIYTEYPEVRALNWFPNREKVLLTDNWDQIVRALENTHGAGAKVAVYPSADIQYHVE